MDHTSGIPRRVVRCNVEKEPTIVGIVRDTTAVAEKD
jgi:hypothetical protein